jgi:hypothetical protein
VLGLLAVVPLTLYESGILINNQVPVVYASGSTFKYTTPEVNFEPDNGSHRELVEASETDAGTLRHLEIQEDWNKEFEKKVLEKVGLAIITADSQLADGKLLPVLEANLAPFPHHIIYSDSITVVDEETGRDIVKPCCGNLTSLGLTLHESQYKLEHTLEDFLKRFPDALFFIYSDHDVWWNPIVLAHHLYPMLTLAKQGQFLVSGGGEYPGWPTHLICGCGAIMSRAMMEHGANPASLEKARQALIAKKIFIPGVKPGALYNNDHLLYALFATSPERVKFLNQAASNHFVFNAMSGKLQDVFKAIRYQIFDNACAGDADSMSSISSCAKLAFSKQVMAVHHIKRADQEWLQKYVTEDVYKWGVKAHCNCTMQILFGPMLPFFMRYGPTPWVLQQEWGGRGVANYASSGCRMQMKDFDCTARDIATHQKIRSTQECCALCALWPACTLYTFIPKRGLCTLKHAQHNKMVAREGVISGIIPSRMVQRTIGNIYL